MFTRSRCAFTGRAKLLSASSNREKILVVFGTRPEVVKLVPVISVLRASEKFEIRTCSTGQHDEMLTQALSLFELTPDHSLSVMTENQSLADLSAVLLERLTEVIQDEAPDLVIVQGDTSTAFLGALSAFYLKVPVAHVEAGLRSGDLANPFPEEANRRLTAGLASLHFAPTGQARENLLAESVDAESIYVTGNTVVDALKGIQSSWKETPKKVQLDPRVARVLQEAAGKKLILVTCHRRENFGDPITDVCEALSVLAETHEDAVIAFPVHLNPNVAKPVKLLLSERKNIHLLPPLDYVNFLALFLECRFCLSDSGGVQEEAPSLGKPVLVLREKTERPEGIECGVAKLVGTDPATILREAGNLLTDETCHTQMCSGDNPYGDGKASERILQAIETWMEKRRKP